MSPAPDSSPLVRRATAWTVGLAVIAGAISAVMFGSEMSLGIALGALLGLANFWMLARALRTVLGNPEQYRPGSKQTWVLPGVILLKWPFILLALGLILWYMPARPEGVAVGALLTLVGASIASIRGNRSSDEPTPS